MEEQNTPGSGRAFSSRFKNLSIVKKAGIIFCAVILVGIIVIVPFAVLKKGNIFGGGGDGDGKGGGGGKEPEPIITDLAGKIFSFNILVGSLKTKSPEYDDIAFLNNSLDDILKSCKNQDPKSEECTFFESSYRQKLAELREPFLPLYESLSDRAAKETEESDKFKDLLDSMFHFSSLSLGELGKMRKKPSRELGGGIDDKGASKKLRKEKRRRSKKAKR